MSVYTVFSLCLGLGIFISSIPVGSFLRISTALRALPVCSACCICFP